MCLLNTKSNGTSKDVLFLCPKCDDTKSSGACRGETEVKNEKKNEFTAF